MFLPLNSLPYLHQQRGWGGEFSLRPPKLQPWSRVWVLLPACVFSAAFLCGEVGKGPENVTTPGSGTTCSLIFFLYRIVINNRHYFYVLWLSEIKWENLSCNKNINVYFFDVIFSAVCYALMSTYFYICLLWSNSLIGRQETLNDLERSLLKTNLRGLER